MNMVEDFGHDVSSSAAGRKDAPEFKGASLIRVQKPCHIWLLGPNSTMALYLDPVGGVEGQYCHPNTQ